MQFEFSATVDKINYRIRTSGDTMIPDEIVDTHAHKHFLMEFQCVFSGSEIFWFPQENRQIRLMPGQILLIPPEVYHSVTTQDGTVERLCFRFSADLVENEHNPNFALYQKIHNVLLFEDPEAFRAVEQSRLLQQNRNSFFSRTRHGMLLLDAVMQLFSKVADMQQPAGQIAPRPDRQKWIIEQYIEKNFSGAASIDGLARELYLSQRQTRKLVHKYLGSDYKTIIIARRMELAQILLRDTDKSLEEIAWQVGYNSYSGFQLCFKNHFGITPSKMRQQLSTTNE